MAFGMEVGLVRESSRILVFKNSFFTSSVFVQIVDNILLNCILDQGWCKLFLLKQFHFMKQNFMYHQLYKIF